MLFIIHSIFAFPLHFDAGWRHRLIILQGSRRRAKWQNSYESLWCWSFFCKRGNTQRFWPVVDIVHHFIRERPTFVSLLIAIFFQLMLRVRFSFRILMKPRSDLCAPRMLPLLGRQLTMSNRNDNNNKHSEKKNRKSEPRTWLVACTRQKLRAFSTCSTVLTSKYRFVATFRAQPNCIHLQMRASAGAQLGEMKNHRPGWQVGCDLSRGRKHQTKR